MKKMILFFSIVGIMLFIIKKQEDFNITRENLNTSIKNESVNTKQTLEDVTMTIKEETLTNKGCTVIIADNNKEPFSYSKWFKIEKNNNKKWEEVKIINDNFSFMAIGYKRKKLSKLECTIEWEKLYGILEKGKYRLVKKFYNNKGIELYLSTEFTIKE